MIAPSARRLWNVFVFLLCISPMTSDNDSETALRLNRSKYSKNIFSYLIINSIRNTFDSVRATIVMSIFSSRLKQRLASLFLLLSLQLMDFTNLLG